MVSADRAREAGRPVAYLRGWANWTNADGTVSGTFGGNTAVFGGAPGVATLGSNVNILDIEFSSNGHVVNGNGFSIIGTGPVTITTDTGVSGTINANIIAPYGVTKTGLGSLFPGPMQVDSLNARAIMVPEERAEEALALISDFRGSPESKP